MARSPYLADLEHSGRSRALVDQSWLRSRTYLGTPEHARATIALDDQTLSAYRTGHPLATALPVLKKLLLDGIEDAGLLVAMGDATGRILWLEGDSSLRTRAEGMNFLEGADWSERTVGTSAPGTALALDHGIQIHADEHFNPQVQAWSCSAAPIHDPQTGTILGFIDITGGATAVAPHALGRLGATVAAIEAHLLLHRLNHPQSTRARLTALGQDTATITGPGTSLTLSARHSEMVLLLTHHTCGLSAEQLADAVYGPGASPLTIRAEVTRLRGILAQYDGDARLESRPYRLLSPWDTDVHELFTAIDRGDYERVLDLYRGPLLPASAAPGIETLREEIEKTVREAMLDAGSDILASYALTHGQTHDLGLYRAALGALDPRSPRRAAVVVRAEQAEAELG